MLKKLLVAFDFDDTLIDANSDIVIQTLAPDGIPADTKSLYSSSSWTKFMGAVFRHLHQRGIAGSQILNCVGKISLVSGMSILLRYLSTAQACADVIIISDSNSVFIEHYLKSAGLSDTVSKVYTNPARFDSTGCLVIEGYHVQDWCKLSTVNLCKGHVLSTHIKEQGERGVKYERVAYVGDGSNDLCPSLRLVAGDVVFPRKGFNLVKNIEENGAIVAKVMPWETGENILDELRGDAN